MSRSGFCHTETTCCSTRLKVMVNYCAIIQVLMEFRDRTHTGRNFGFDT